MQWREPPQSSRYFNKTLPWLPNIERKEGAQGVLPSLQNSHHFLYIKVICVTMTIWLRLQRWISFYPFSEESFLNILWLYALILWFVRGCFSTDVCMINRCTIVYVSHSCCILLFILLTMPVVSLILFLMPVVLLYLIVLTVLWTQGRQCCGESWKNAPTEA